MRTGNKYVGAGRQGGFHFSGFAVERQVLQLRRKKLRRVLCVELSK